MRQKFKAYIHRESGLPLLDGNDEEISKLLKEINKNSSGYKLEYEKNEKDEYGNPKFYVHFTRSKGIFDLSLDLECAFGIRFGDFGPEILVLDGQSNAYLSYYEPHFTKKDTDFDPIFEVPVNFINADEFKKLANITPNFGENL